MTKYKLLNVFTIFLLISLSNYSIAQTTVKPCGPTELDRVANSKAMLYAKTHSTQVLPGTLIRVFFHICADNNGNNLALQPTQIEPEFTALVNAYRSDNVCFVKMGQEVINNSSLNDSTNGSAGAGAGFPYLAYNYSGNINVWYVNNIRGANPSNNGGGFGGITFGSPNNYCLVAASNVGDNNTIAHEVGHALGLLHTFDTAAGKEMINGANSTTAGDRVPDTPADPYAYLAKSCYSASGCNYTGSCPDPNNQTNFTPPYSNRMGYWACVKPLIFTNGQFARVNSFISTSQMLIDCTSPSNFTVPPGSYGGKYFQSAINTLTTDNNTVTMSGIVKASLGGAHVHLLPGFHASPSLNSSFVRIESSPCN